MKRRKSRGIIGSRGETEVQEHIQIFRYPSVKKKKKNPISPDDPAAGLSTSAGLVAQVTGYDRVAAALVTHLPGRRVVRVLDVVHDGDRVQRLHRRFPLVILVPGEVRLGHPVGAVGYRQDLPTQLGRQKIAGHVRPALVANGIVLAAVGRWEVRVLLGFRRLRPVHQEQRYYSTVRVYVTLDPGKGRRSEDQMSGDEIPYTVRG